MFTFSLLLLFRISQCGDSSAQQDSLQTSNLESVDALDQRASLDFSVAAARVENMLQNSQMRRAMNLSARGVLQMSNSSHEDSRDVARDRLASEQRVRACVLKALLRNPMPSIEPFHQELQGLATAHNTATDNGNFGELTSDADKELKTCQAIVDQLNNLKNEYKDLYDAASVHEENNKKKIQETREKIRLSRWKLVGFLNKAQKAHGASSQQEHVDSHEHVGTHENVDTHQQVESHEHVDHHEETVHENSVQVPKPHTDKKESTDLHLGTNGMDHHDSDIDG